MPPWVMRIRFCSIMALVSSSHVQVQAMPLWIFSMVIVQRGAIIMPPAMAPDMAGIKSGFGVDASTDGLTHREIQARRAQVRDKFDGRGRPGRKRRSPK